MAAEPNGNGTRADGPHTSSTATPRTTRRQVAILAGILVGTALLYFWLYDPSRFGSTHDDSLYVASAKALAEGQGYRLISLPSAPAATKHPPFYPILLSLIWRISPNFPANINLMVSLSVVTTLVFLAITWRYLTECGYANNPQALLIVAVVALNWRIVLLGTGIYSEMLYAAISVAGLFLAERYERKSSGWAAGVVLGIVLSLAFLTRSSGVALPVGVVVYFVLRRQIRQSILLLSIVGLFVVGWFGWCYANRTTEMGINIAYYTNYVGHLNQVLHELAALNRTSLMMTILSVLARNAVSLVAISVPVVCLGIEYNRVAYLGFAMLFVVAGFVREVSRGWKLLHVYTVSYLVVHILWLPFVSYDRFLMPLLPFLMLWMFREIGAILVEVRRVFKSDNSIARKGAAGIVGLAMIATVSVVLYSYGSTLASWSRSATLEKEPKPVGDDAEAIAWIKVNSDPSDVLVCGRDPLYYLYTDRKATHSLPMSPGVDWQNDPTPVLEIVRESEGRYVIVTAADRDYESLKAIFDQRPSQFLPVFTSHDRTTSVYRVDTAVTQP
jgi:hypothetical protein